MSQNVYRLLQLTNPSVGVVAAAAFMPFGTVTRQIKRDADCPSTFVVATNNNNTVYVQEPGFYKITYNANLVAAAAGLVTLNLQINGTTVYTTNVTATAGGTVQVAFTFMTRVFDNCCSNAANLPIQIQIQNNGVGLTGGGGNLIVERVAKVCC